MMKTWQWIGLGVVALAALGAGAYWWNARPAASTEHAAPTTAESHGDRPHIHLTPELEAAAGIACAPVERRQLQRQLVVPGRIDYDGTRHIAVRTPTESVVRKMLVRPGDRVEVGQVCAILDSAEIGDRRADVLLRQAELDLAERENEWRAAVQQNLADFLKRLADRVEPDVLEREFADRNLGTFRESILPAYSRMRLSEKLASNLQPLAEQGIATGRALLEQTSARQINTAEFRSLCEQAKFDARQQASKAATTAADAQRRVAVAEQRLKALTGGETDMIDLAAHLDSLSTWPVKAPLAGTIEEVPVATAERVQHGETLFILADTDRLWVQAELREHAWQALTLSAGQQIDVQSPALPGRSFTAEVLFTGRSVSAESKSLPLTAGLDNAEKLLRPGLFVRVSLPDGPPREATAVPASAVIQHEGRSYVFVKDDAGGYAPTLVETGMIAEPWIEIVSGVSAGASVAVRGTFALKSQWLLEAEE